MRENKSAAVPGGRRLRTATVTADFTFYAALIAMHCIMLQEYPVVQRLIELPGCGPFMPGKAEPVEAL